MHRPFAHARTGTESDSYVVTTTEAVRQRYANADRQQNRTIAKETTSPPFFLTEPEKMKKNDGGVKERKEGTSVKASTRIATRGLSPTPRSIKRTQQSGGRGGVRHSRVKVEEKSFFALLSPFFNALSLMDLPFRSRSHTHKRSVSQHRRPYTEGARMQSGRLSSLVGVW